MSVIDGLGASIDKIVITGIVESIYFALIHIRTEDSLAIIDARPSDSIALAVRCDAPIYISDNLNVIDPVSDPDQDAIIMEKLHIINPEDLLSI
jgi:bifunctional DNase/RNase